jgi:thiol-disulfide isomerase/thioredoxin
MKAHLKLFLTCAALAAALVGARAFGGGGPALGAAPPEIKAEGWLNADGGKPVALADLHGKVVVVEFWATWCPPCRKSIPHLQALYEKHKADGLVIIGLSDEPKDKVEPFAKKMNMGYVVGFGSNTGEAYGVEGIPTAFVIGADGKLVWSGHPMDDKFEKTLEQLLEKKG